EDENTSLNDEGMTNVPKIADDFGIVDRGNGVAIEEYYGEKKDVVIPDEINGESVVEIGNKAFYKKYITSVTIPSSVTTIGDSAFASNLLKRVEIPSNVTTIGDSAFASNLLKRVEIPSSMTMIGNSVFASNLLTNVEIPSSVTTIGEMAFYHNELKSVNIPPNVTTIGEQAFKINKLESVEIPSSVTTIEKGVFAFNLLKRVEISPNVSTIREGAFYENKLESIEIPSSVTTIGSRAFMFNQLTSVKIPPKVTTIEKDVFSWNKLESIAIHENVTTIEESAFAANELTNVTIPPKVTTIADETFSGNELENVAIHENVTMIGKAAFYNNKLKNIYIPPSVTRIGSYAFMFNHLESVVIPPNVTEIEEFSFYDNKLTSVKIPSNVTSIGDYAFIKNQLTNVDIPSSVTTIGKRAFRSNPLEVVNFNGDHNFQWDKEEYPFAPYKEGEKYFLGWFEDKDSTRKWNYSVTKPMTIYAKWRMFVKFDSNGGSEVPTQPVVYGELTEAPTTPVKEGYTFEGWHKDEDLTEVWNFDQNVVKKDITLFAKWSKVSYIVTFDTNGGSAVSSQVVGYNELVKAPSTPNKEGYTFGGWHKDEELTIPWDFAKDVVTKNVTLYAKWTKDNTSGGGSGGSGGGSSNYQVIFDSNGGNKVPSQTVGYNDLLKVPTTPVKDGYEFIGWHKDAELKNTWDFTKDKVTADITLYAKWKKDDVSEVDYIVTFDSNGGSKILSQTVAYKALVKAPSNPTKEGYLFIGWYKDEKFTKAWDFAKDVVSKNLTLYARWMKDSKRCDITFKDIDHNWAQDMIKEVAKRCIIIGYPDGTFRPNDIIQRQHVVLMIDRALQPASIRDAVSFLDVPKSHVNYEQITRLQRAGIVDGSNGAFRPNASITRAEMAKVIVIAFGLTPEGNSTFKDVDSSHWASEYIAALADHNIALGDENGNFRPNDNLTRAQFTAIMYRALGL
ncbi:leucine-rich repeat protein, partial [Lysinibacillus sp. NPDC093692]|uniref:leucine-rich repeat protein n=1 Tax=Lysinibacillus sp. NPDC093692 TaxID=3390578 RepID=UPI003D006DB7